MTDLPVRPSRRAVALLVAILIALAAATTWAVIEIRHDSKGKSASSERTKVTTLAGQYAVDFTSTDYRTMQTQAAVEAKNATAAFGAVYTGTIKTFASFWAKHKITEKTSVRRMALSTLGSTSAVALVALDATTTTDGKSTQRLLRIQITLSKVNGRWLMSNLSQL